MNETEDITKTYSNDAITVVWKPAMCIHSTHCFTELPAVFNPKARPWVNAAGASTQRIIDQVDRCPSKALSYVWNDKQATGNAPANTRVVVTANGPLMVHGSLLVQTADGQETTKREVTAFCRCGASQHKPYCDGSHAAVSFEG